MLVACFMPGLFVTPRSTPSKGTAVVIINQTVALFHQDVQCQLYGYLSCCGGATKRKMEKDCQHLSRRGCPQCIPVDTLVECLGDVPGVCGVFNTPQLFVAVFLHHLTKLEKWTPLLLVPGAPLATLRTKLQTLLIPFGSPGGLNECLVQKWVAKSGPLRPGGFGTRIKLLTPPRKHQPLAVKHGFVMVEGDEHKLKLHVAGGIRCTFNGTTISESVDVCIWACSMHGLVAVIEIDIAIGKFAKAVRRLCAEPFDVVGDTALQAIVESNVVGSSMHVAPGAPTTLCALRGLDAFVTCLCTHAGPPGLKYSPGSAMRTMLYVCSNPPAELADHFSGVSMDLCRHMGSHKRQMFVMHTGILAPACQEEEVCRGATSLTFSERRSWTRNRCNQLPTLIAASRQCATSWSSPCFLCGSALATHQETTNSSLVIGQGFDTFRTHLHDKPSTLSRYNVERVALCETRPWFTAISIRGCVSDPPVFTGTVFKSLLATLGAHPTPFPLLVHAHCKHALLRRCSAVLCG